MAKETPNATDHIVSLNMNGLKGRMMRIPAAKNANREILVVYGHHSNLERWWGLVQNFNTYGAVTMPDLPGFGGMDSFATIGRKPTIDNFADYLAAFCKMRYKRRRVTIVGISFGFVVATRMLQRYPDLAKKVDLLVCAAGFSHHEDFRFTKVRKFMYKTLCPIVAGPVIRTLFKWVALNPWMLRQSYSRTHNAKHKFAEVSGLPDQFETMMNIEIDLWRSNDVRTQFSTMGEFFRLNNCTKRVHIPVWNVYSKQDQYFDPTVVEQHLRQIFDDYHDAPAVLKNHVVSVLADKKETAPFIPAKLRRYLARQ